jgi:hypothetical protein
VTSVASPRAAEAARSRAGRHSMALRAASRSLRERSAALGISSFPTAPDMAYMDGLLLFSGMEAIQ